MTAERRLRDPERFQASVRSFQFLGTSASGATDLDCVIERHKRFLVIEGKTWHDGGIQVPLGQSIALTQLTRIMAVEDEQCPHCGSDLDVTHPFRVLLVGETDGETYHVMEYDKPAPLTETKRGAHFPSNRFTAHTRSELRDLVQSWYASC